MIFVVFSCDEPKGTENTEPQQPGTTGGSTSDNSNPYEELEKTLYGTSI